LGGCYWTRADSLPADQVAALIEPAALIKPPADRAVALIEPAALIEPSTHTWC
jgi:hypothetical protein